MCALDPSLELEPWPRRQCMVLILFNQTHSHYTTISSHQPQLPVLLLQTFSQKGNTKLMIQNRLVFAFFALSHETWGRHKYVDRIRGLLLYN